MEDPMMKRLLSAVVPALMLGLSACAATVTVDGYGAAYCDRPVVEHARRWHHRGVVVYEVNGRYYREHEGRWIVYHERPRELVEVTVR
jgi:hypothetical protein